MSLQQGSRTAWRYRIAQDSLPWVLGNTLYQVAPPSSPVGAAYFPDIIPGAHQRAARIGIAIRSLSDVTGATQVAGTTIPLNTPGYAVYSDIIPGARERFARVGVAIRAMDVQGNTLYQLSPPTAFMPDLSLPPKGRPYPMILRGSVQGTPNVMIFAPPFAYYDWPVPKGRPYPMALRSSVQSVPDVIILNPPFAYYDWPVPQRYRRSQELLTWGLPANPNLYTPFPFNQYDWPNPRGYPYPRILRGSFGQPLPYIYPIADITLPARYAPLSQANARYATLTDFLARYAAAFDRTARYAPEQDSTARYAPETDSNARHAPETDSEARYD